MTLAIADTVLRRFAVACLAVVLATKGCAFAELKPDHALKNLRNEEIEWHGTTAGLQPIVRGENAKALLKAVDGKTDQSLVRIFNERQFAAAHVLLSLRLDRERSTSGEKWNGLAVDLLADGSVKVDPSQRVALQKQWEKRLLPKQAK